MSGGSWDYLYSRVTEAASRLEETPLESADSFELGYKVPTTITREDIQYSRMALGQLLRLVADALHDIEWVDSSDYGNGREVEAINKVFTEAVRLHQEALARAEKKALGQ